MCGGGVNASVEIKEDPAFLCVNVRTETLCREAGA